MAANRRKPAFTAIAGGDSHSCEPVALILGADRPVPFRREFDHTLVFETIVAGVVFLIVVGLAGWAVVRYRAGRDGGASQDTEHPRLETAYAIALLGIALAVVFVTRQAMAADNQAPSRTALPIEVTGFQWCWRFHYFHPAITIAGSCEGDETPTLVVPAGQPIRILATSSDVIHSFWVPAFRFKMDAFPHHVNSFVITVPHPGRWEGHCAEFCGEDHAFMTFHLLALTPSAFQRWERAHQQVAPA